MKSMNGKPDGITRHSLPVLLPRSTGSTGIAPLASLALGFAALLMLTVPATAVVNGEVDTDENYPNVGALVVVAPLPVTSPGLDLPQTFSSGTLIHPRVLLTAGHTVEFIEFLMAANSVTLDAFRVSFAVDANDPASFIEIESVQKHPSYVRANPGEASLDVGVVILKTAVALDPVTLAPPGFLDDLIACGELGVAQGWGTPLIVVGYGVDAPPPHPLLILPPGIRHWASSGYQALMPSYLILSQSIGRGEGGSATGDSGGPAFWMDPDSGQLVQVGIVSLQSPVAAGMGHYCRTDLPEVIEFLEETIAGVED